MKILSRERSNFTACAEVWTVVPDAIDQQFLLIVTRPAAPPADGPLCGVIQTDGDAYAGALASAVGSMMLPGELPPTVTVSIAYPLDPPTAWHLLRNRDLTPSRNPASEAMLQDLIQGNGPQTGGGPALLQFILDEVRPAIEKAYGVDPRRWTLTGISLGGLFTVNALLTKPGAFRRYNAVSPSLWWQRPLMFDRAREFAARSEPVDAAIYLSVGDQETLAHLHAVYDQSPPEIRKNAMEAFGGTDMVEDMHEMGKILSPTPGLKVKSKAMENESHHSIYGVALSQGLRWLSDATKD